ncbi:winged helix-turn-helix domain-containing protein [Microbacterium limosum]|uniref:Winged helix-turn-helix domain-containing protein n=1 Tax=Microbacterium limosum TaxID=3079935 RepID=A0AAU0MIK9_9MICO|nr:winged helix-turn-helix domain-containing protein [Microbacterium sp. Y20]WOQ70387.1 winged helix-turn-helix domain-containing protein [Microbacterium sp. Y20]
MAQWTFLTHHAHVLLAVAQNNDAAVRDIAAVVGVTPRSALTILNDLESAGYLEREKRGRRNHYVLHADRPLRHPSNAAHTVDDLIRALLDVT